MPREVADLRIGGRAGVEGDPAGSSPSRRSGLASRSAVDSAAAVSGKRPDPLCEANEEQEVPKELELGCIGKPRMVKEDDLRSLKDDELTCRLAEALGRSLTSSEAVVSSESLLITREERAAGRLARLSHPGD